jgi:hypothetical protein
MKIQGCLLGAFVMVSALALTIWCFGAQQSFSLGTYVKQGGAVSLDFDQGSRFVLHGPEGDITGKFELKNDKLTLKFVAGGWARKSVFKVIADGKLLDSEGVEYSLQGNAKPYLRPGNPAIAGSVNPGMQGQSAEFQAAIQHGEALRAAGDLRSALDEFHRALTLSERSSLAHYYVAEILFSEKNYSDAGNQYRLALQGDGQPRWIEALSHVQLGKISDLNGNRSDAQNEFKQAIQTNDDSHGAIAEARKYLDSPFQENNDAKSSAVTNSVQAPQFSNSDVMRLISAGVPDAVIIQKIRSCNCQLDTSTDSIIQLKKAGASAAIMQAMINPGSTIHSNGSSNSPPVSKTRLGSGTRTPAPAPAVNRAVPSKDPVAAAVDVYVQQHFLRCGGEFYSTQGNAWQQPVHFQFKNLQFSWGPLPLSRADNLNGISWQGTLHIRCEAYRTTECNGQWCAWEDCRGSGITAFRSFKPDIRLTNRNGQWSYQFSPPRESMAESGSSQLVDSMAPAGRGCSSYEALIAGQ